jgi:hypothetical protein
MVDLQMFFGTIEKIPKMTKRGYTMIYNTRSELNFEGRGWSERKNKTFFEVTAMLELLGIESQYFQNLLGIDAYSFSSLTDDLPICLWVHDEHYTIIHGNNHFMEYYGSCVKRTCYQYLMGGKTPCSCCLARRSFANNRPQSCKFCKRNEFGYELNSFHTPVTNKHGDRFILKSSFHVGDVETLDDIYSDCSKDKNDPNKGAGGQSRVTFLWDSSNEGRTENSW